MKTFIIKGGNFKNTGAEAMTYITIDELRKRYPSCAIYLISNYDYLTSKNCDNLKLNITKFDNNNYNFMCSPINRLITSFVVKLKDFKNHRNDFPQLKVAEDIIKECDAVIDISGFALSSQWGIKASINYLNFIEIVDRYNVPIYLMPQSFGPFDYGKDTEKMLYRIKSVLTRCNVIYAREKEGYKLLSNLGLTNVQYSCDMVLQNRGVNPRNIFVQQKKYNDIDVSTKNNVAVVPNMRNFDHGNKKQLLELYSHIIEKLLSMNETIYLISHSKEDHEACSLIQKKFSDNSNIILLENDFDSFSFTNIIKKFDFVIASRFHSIVHAYKECIPCIAIGWATKYYELLELFESSQFMVDVRDLPDERQIDIMLEKMNKCWSDERDKIEMILKKIQENNCFEKLNI